MNKYLLLLILSCSCGAVFAQEFIYTTPFSSRSDVHSQLSIDALYNNPNAIIVAIPLDETKHLLKYPVGVWNNGVNCYLFNEDKSPMKEGIKFKLIYSVKPDSTHFLFQADLYTLKGDVAYIDKPALNNNPGAEILASMSEHPSGIYSKSEIGFKYDNKKQKWYVYNLDNTPITKDLGMYIIVQKPTYVKTNTPIIKDTLPRVIKPIITDGTLTPLVTKDVEFPNWNFEKGLSEWSKEGTAFNNQPTFGDNVATTRILSRMELNNGGVAITGKTRDMILDEMGTIGWAHMKITP